MRARRGLRVAGVSLCLVVEYGVAEEAVVLVREKGEKEKFLERFEEYGYPLAFGRNASEFEGFVEREVGVRLKGDVYLDWAGSALYTNSQVEAMAEDLKRSVYGNPHSLSSSATRSTEAVEAARLEILEYLGASEDEYEVIFTRSCTDSLRLVAEAFPWAPDAEFRYLVQNHNSVLGIRDVARARGAAARALDATEVDQWLAHSHEEAATVVRDFETADYPEKDRAKKDSSPSLFAYPGEENFAGEMFPMEWASKIVAARRDPRSPLHNWRVLVDAAKMAASHPVNLTETPADFVTVSFYKLFGAPTGVGALVARKQTAEELTKCYWGGGSVSVAGPGRDEEDDVRVLKSRICERFEDGTVSFLGIAELRHGFQALRLVGGPRAVEAHASALANYLDDRLRGLRHPRTQFPVVRVYGPDDRGPLRGPVVNFNLLDKDGAQISHIDVMERAAKRGIHVRAGVECNPGAGYQAMGLPPKAVHKLATDDSLLGCGEGPAFVTCDAADLRHGPDAFVSEIDFGSDPGRSALGCAADFLSGPDREVSLPTGSIRASIGYLSTFRDIDALVTFVQHFFDNDHHDAAPSSP